jgi:SagB-type dehydrogenase family enzyme
VFDILAKKAGELEFDSIVEGIAIELNVDSMRAIKIANDCINIGALLSVDDPAVCKFQEDYLKIWEKHHWEDLAYLLLNNMDQEFIEPKTPSWVDSRRAVYDAYVSEIAFPRPSFDGVSVNLCGAVYELPAPEIVSGLNFFEALIGRRTIRNFANRAVSQQTFSSLMYAAFAEARQIRVHAETKVQEDSAEFSNSKFTSFEVAVFIHNVDGIESGLYWYSIGQHNLRKSNKAINEDDVVAVTIGMQFSRKAAFDLFLVSIFERVMWRYRCAKKYNFLLQEVGALGQNVISAAHCYGLGTFMSPAFVDTRFSELFGTEPFEFEPLYFIAVGHACEEK